MDSFGTLLRRQLADRETSVAKLCKEYFRQTQKPLSRQLVHKWLKDQKRPGEDKLLVLFDILNVPVTDRRRWANAAGYQTLLDAVFPPGRAA